MEKIKSKMLRDYKVLYKHYENCFDKYGDNHKGVDWPDRKQAQDRYKIMLDVIKNKNKETSVLDFGCGLSHLYEYIQSEKIGNIVYTGCDISEKFIQVSKNKYPQNNYFIVDMMNDNLPQRYDYIICNGVFTEKRELSHTQMSDFYQKMIKNLFEYVNVGLAFNVMSKQVDWERDDLFHLSLDELAWFLHKNNMRNFIIRNDYGLYEYTIYIYSDCVFYCQIPYNHKT